jgi:glycosyltransferase involved in cell wall biosynthesis
MKIYFNRRPTVGPWGGGSKVLFAITQECLKKGHKVFYEEHIRTNEFYDVLFCMDPRPNSFTCFEQLIEHKFRHNSKIVQRIGDLGTHGKPELLDAAIRASSFSDLLIFPSKWALNYFGSTPKKSIVIENAPLKKFQAKDKKESNNKKISIVSHHWSDNMLKGFDVYKELDEYCSRSSEYSFTFVGRKPQEVKLSNYIPPLDVDGLISELPKHDVYVTASRLEAGANHVLEAMALGLPVLYHKEGGSINEYCKEFGMAYKDKDDLINILKNEGDTVRSMIGTVNYCRSSEDMAKEYVDILESFST